MTATMGTSPREGAAGLGTDVVLRASHVSVEYAGSRPTRAVRDVSLELRRGEVLGIVGESGCGKSTLAYALTRMLRPPARMTGGVIEYFDRDGAAVDLAALRGDRLREFRWNKIAMVFQSAMNALNPVTTVGSQMDDIFRTHRPGMDKAARRSRAGALLEMVGIDPRRLRSFPHELSGGMRQRVVIAMALALEPEIVVMDEPTTALDVLVQREILDEVERLRARLGFSVVFITHDLALLLEISDRLAVMYAGRMIEYAPAEQVAAAPRHPYTRGLLRSFPDLRGERREMHGIPGSPPDLRTELVGCAFAPRCESVFEPCRTIAPPLSVAGRTVSGVPGVSAVGWPVACHLHDPRYAPPDEAPGTGDQPVDDALIDTAPEGGR